MSRAGQDNQLRHKAKASVMIRLHHYLLFCNDSHVTDPVETVINDSDIA
jgi:hypothetical protein